ncbi:unnamed protein product [Protopolystoma xenopodis]|uniref:PKD/REJ-like domain-containing protein n=1 Tax=Protopolystoma xenopodis TaxID=117903 RepID=A0A3S5ALQ6_9PLAT|nr:unnamed protein product [Protopolystoma xenopodis]
MSAKIVELPCSLSQKNSRIWSVFELDEARLQAVEKVVLPDNINLKTTLLSLPSNSLPIGLYAVLFNVTMILPVGQPVISTVITAYLRVTPSKLMIQFTPTNQVLITVGLVQKEFCLTPGSFSYDPDLNNKSADQASIQGFRKVLFNYIPKTYI